MHPATRSRKPAPAPTPAPTSTPTPTRTPSSTPVRASGRTGSTARRLPAAEPTLAEVIPLFRTGPAEGPARPAAPRPPSSRTRRTGAEGDVVPATALGLVCGAATVQLARLAVALQPPVATATLAVGVFALGALAVQRAATGSPRRRLAFLAAALVAVPLTTALDGVRWSPADVAGYALLAAATLVTAAYAGAQRRRARAARPSLQLVWSR